MTLCVINSRRKERLIKAKRIAMETGIPSSHDPPAGKGEEICLVTTPLMSQGAQRIPGSAAAAKGAAGSSRWGGEAAPRSPNIDSDGRGLEEEGMLLHPSRIGTQRRTQRAL